MSYTNKKRENGKLKIQQLSSLTFPHPSCLKVPDHNEDSSNNNNNNGNTNSATTAVIYNNDNNSNINGNNANVIKVSAPAKIKKKNWSPKVFK